MLVKIDIKDRTIYVDKEEGDPPLPYFMDLMTLDEWADVVNAINESKGWNVERSASEWAALAHSEVSEFYEEFRNGHYAQEIYGVIPIYNGEKTIQQTENQDITLCPVGTKPEGQAIEMADLLIRTLHWFAQNSMSVEKAIALKMRYNTTRPYRHGNKKA